MARLPSPAGSPGSLEPWLIHVIPLPPTEWAVIALLSFHRKVDPSPPSQRPCAGNCHESGGTRPDPTYARAQPTQRLGPRTAALTRVTSLVPDNGCRDPGRLRLARSSGSDWPDVVTPRPTYRSGQPRGACQQSAGCPARFQDSTTPRRVCQPASLPSSGHQHDGEAVQGASHVP